MKRWLGPADGLLQQGAWWCAVLCAAHGAPGLAALAGAAVLVAHLLVRSEERVRVASTALAAALYGLATDTLLRASGLVSFAGAGVASPAWMVGLWAAFAAGLTASLRVTLRWPPLALAAAAALAGPLAYRAGAALGALAFPAGSVALLAVAAQWCLGVPLLARIARVPIPDLSGPAGAPSSSAEALEHRCTR